MTTLQGDPMSLVLETLGRDETLDLWGLLVWFLAFALGLDFTADDEFANLLNTQVINTPVIQIVGVDNVHHRPW